MTYTLRVVVRILVDGNGKKMINDQQLPGNFKVDKAVGQRADDEFDVCNVGLIEVTQGLLCKSCESGIHLSQIVLGSRCLGERICSLQRFFTLSLFLRLHSSYS